MIAEAENSKNVQQAMKIDEKIQRQLNKEEKQRVIAQNKKVQREETAKLKRLAQEEARKAKEAQKNITNTRKSIRNRKKKASIVILDEEDYAGVDAGPAEGGVAPPPKSRPRRTRRLPQHLQDYQIELD